jgi:hypothetical protein
LIDWSLMSSELYINYIHVENKLIEWMNNWLIDWLRLTL